MKKMVVISMDGVVCERLDRTSFPSAYIKAKPLEDGIFMVRTLSEMGFDILFISSRPLTTSTATHRWLNRNISGYSQCLGYYVNVTDKADFLKDVFPDFVVTADQMEQLEKSGKQVICWSRDYNAPFFPRFYVSDDVDGKRLMLWSKPDEESEVFKTAYAEMVE